MSVPSLVMEINYRLDVTQRLLGTCTYFLTWALFICASLMSLQGKGIPYFLIEKYFSFNIFLAGAGGLCVCVWVWFVSSLTVSLVDNDREHVAAIMLMWIH